MVRILLPDDNLAERYYVTIVLLKEIMGLDIDLVFGKNKDYILVLENGSRLLIKDHFFGKYPKEKNYLDSKNIPLKAQLHSKCNNPFITESDLPVIFGDDRIEISSTEIVCGADIFASSFFMLTRWEEYASRDRDCLGRFPAIFSLASREGFLHRPVVNEYIEMLWNMFCHLGILQEKKKRSFQLLLSHDVDYPLLWTSFPFFLKKLGGDILKRQSLKEANFSIKSFILTKIGKEKDPYDTFDFLMHVAENANVAAHFFFMAGCKAKLDPEYDIEQDFVKKLIEKIHERGHRIGIHPGIGTANNGLMLQQQLKLIRSASPTSIKHGRQHFLHFETPTTWELYENNEIHFDHTLGYPEQPGFRCGTCYQFPVFNFITRKQLNLIEVPLIAMEASYVVYQKLPPKKVSEDLMSLAKRVKKYGGTFSLLWHNSSFNVPEYAPYQSVYQSFVEETTSL